MEMNFKQWIVDFVNQSLLQMSTCDVESKRYERIEFAECLGEMNLRWHRLQASLNRKVCVLVVFSLAALVPPVPVLCVLQAASLPGSENTAEHSETPCALCCLSILLSPGQPMEWSGRM